MLNLNLEALGVTEEALERTILASLGMTREQAVRALAEKFGVSLAQPATVVSNGDEVLTSQGNSRAAVLTEAEQRTLRDAAAITQRIFS